MHKLYFLLFLLMVGCATTSNYEDAVSKWDSHKDVARWMRMNFTFDYNSFSGTKNHEEVYKYRRGDCRDATNFTVQTLNRINPQYNSRWVFVTNEASNIDHWAAAFDYNGKLYIMDYGTGWELMQGIHGPYNSLSEYQKFLARLHLPNFKVGFVTFSDPMSPANPTIADAKQFVKYENGVIYDKRTKLEWVVGPDQDMNWDEANTWAKNLKIQGKPWRLPSISELARLYTIDKDGYKTNILMNSYQWLWSSDNSYATAKCVMFFGNGGWTQVDRRESISRRAFAVRTRE